MVLSGPAWTARLAASSWLGRPDFFFLPSKSTPTFHSIPTSPNTVVATDCKFTPPVDMMRVPHPKGNGHRVPDHLRRGSTQSMSTHPKGTYAFVSLGCPKNLVDSERM